MSRRLIGLQELHQLTVTTLNFKFIKRGEMQLQGHQRPPWTIYQAEAAFTKISDDRVGSDDMARSIFYPGAQTKWISWAARDDDNLAARWHTTLSTLESLQGRRSAS